MNLHQFALGLDIGGTNLASAVVARAELGLRAGVVGAAWYAS